MVSDGWIPYDRDSQRELQIMNALPDAGVLVWIYDNAYHGVTPGIWQGSWWETYWGSDDVAVLAWMPMEFPDDPHALIDAYEATLNLEDDE